MNPAIFREYDIRGIAGEDITDDDVVSIGKAFGTYLRTEGRKNVIVGRDCRLTSGRYRERLVEGLLATGCDVLDVGVCPTPVLYFSIRHFERQGGVMITASHNPAEYNGFKLCIGHDTLFGEQIRRVCELMEQGAFSEGRGQVEMADAVTPYKEFLQKNIKLSKRMRVGVDAGNGTAGVVAVPTLRALGCQVFDLYCDMDGTFPNHEADPTVIQNMQDLIELVRREQLDVGIGYDGDGDRIGVIDEKGNIIWGDQLMIIYAREILSRKPGAVFISEVKCSQTLYDDIEQHGGRAIMWKTGHSLIKRKMKEVGAELAGEMSGHMFFADRYFGYDDAIYASCRLLEVLGSTGKTISELLSDVPKTYTTPEIRVTCPDETKFQLVKEITQYFRQQEEIIDIDGVRVLYEDGWGLVRASNTQPALVLRFEAFSPGRLSEIRSHVESIVAEMQKA